MRAFLDANILISYLLRPRQGGPVHTVVTAAFAREYALLVSDALLGELQRKTAEKRYLADRITREDTAELVDIILAVAEVVPPIESNLPALTRDPKDDYLLAYAVVGRADYLVTGDDDLLVLREVEGVKIVSPAEFAELTSSRS